VSLASTTSTEQSTTVNATQTTSDSLAITSSSDVNTQSVVNNTNAPLVTAQSTPQTDSNIALIGGIVGGVLGLICIVGVIAISAFIFQRRRGNAPSSELPSIGNQMQAQPTANPTNRNQYDIIPNKESNYEIGRIE
jgi:hypothetical protein